ncbi:MAG: hypothetical protein AAF196_20975 [Planctomycetota bacterium]
MASGWTDRGNARAFEILFQGATPAEVFHVALVSNAVTPTVATNTFGELDEIPAGNGYDAGGIQINRGTTDFDSLVEGNPTVQEIRDIIWTASGGTLPSAGSGARWGIVMTDDPVIADREVWMWIDMEADRTAGIGEEIGFSGLPITGSV